MATAKKTTIHDVTLAASASVSTVSLVLSGKERISTATEERVNTATEELGLVHDRQASALHGGQSGVIGLIVRDLFAPFYAESTAGLTEALETQGQMVLLLRGGKDNGQLAQRFSPLLNQGADGVVITGAIGDSDDLRWMTKEKVIPMIFASRVSYFDDAGTIRPGDVQVVQSLMEHLVHNGHQHIAWLGGQSSPLTLAERVGSYCATLLKFGLPFRSNWVLECTSSQKQAVETITALLHYNPTISAVVYYDGTTAVGTWFGLLRAGRRSGKSEVDRCFEQQVPLAAFTNATPTTLDDIPAIWVSTSTRELGTTLADHMAQKVTHEETHSRNLIAPARPIAEKQSSLYLLYLVVPFPQG